MSSSERERSIEVCAVCGIPMPQYLWAGARIVAGGLCAHRRTKRLALAAPISSEPPGCSHGAGRIDGQCKRCLAPVAPDEAYPASEPTGGGEALRWLRDRSEYARALADTQVPGEFDEIARARGGQVAVERAGVVDVFVQHYEEAVEHTPDEARELAWALLVAADIAEARERELYGDASPDTDGGA